MRKLQTLPVRKTWSYLCRCIRVSIASVTRIWRRPQSPFSFDPRKGDPLILLLTRVHGWLNNNWVSLFLLLGFLFFGSVFIAALIEGVHFRSATTNATFIKDAAAPAHFALLNPLAMVVIVRYYRRLTGVLVGVQNFVNITDDMKDQLLRAIQASYECKWITSGALVLSIIGVAGFFLLRHSSPASFYIFLDGHPPGEHWDVFTHVSASGWLTFVWATLITYIIVVITLKTLVTIWFGWAYRGYPLKYNWSHSDGCAGLGEIGGLLVHLAGIIVIVGAIISMFWVSDALYPNDLFRFRFLEQFVLFRFLEQFAFFRFVDQFGTFRVLTSSFLYILLAPVLFFIPLMYFHGGMRSRKQEILDQIAARQEADNTDPILPFLAASKQLPEWPIPKTGIIKLLAYTIYLVTISGIAPTLFTIYFGLRG